MTAAGLPACSGPRIKCPKCGMTGVLTEWHWAGSVRAPKQMAGREPPCKNIRELGEIRAGEHLCRLCRNCGYGWPEALATSRDGGPLTPAPDEEATVSAKHDDRIPDRAPAMPAAQAGGAG